MKRVHLALLAACFATSLLLEFANATGEVGPKPANPPSPGKPQSQGMAKSQEKPQSQQMPNSQENPQSQGEPQSQKPQSPQKPPLPLFKTFTFKYRSINQGVIRWEEVYCDGEKGRAKVLITIGAAKEQTNTYYFEKDAEHQHGLKVTFSGKYGDTYTHEPCTNKSGTADKPVKIDKLFIDMSKYQYQATTQWNTAEVEYWRHADSSLWIIKRDGDKITPLEYVTTAGVKREVETFSTSPLDEGTFKLSNYGKLDRCKVKAPKSDTAAHHSSSSDHA